MPAEYASALEQHSSQAGGWVLVIAGVVGILLTYLVIRAAVCHGTQDAIARMLPAMRRAMIDGPGGSPLERDLPLGVRLLQGLVVLAIVAAIAWVASRS